MKQYKQLDVENLDHHYDEKEMTIIQVEDIVVVAHHANKKQSTLFWFDTKKCYNDIVHGDIHIDDLVLVENESNPIVRDEIAHSDIHTQVVVIEDIGNGKVRHKVSEAPLETTEEDFDNFVQGNTMLKDTSSPAIPEITQ
jgi:hypothetical protein